jgi:hypothetical protein
MPSADSSAGISAPYAALSPLPWHATSLGTAEASRGTRSSRRCRDRRMYKAPPMCGWRTSRSCARSSRRYHTSYPVRAPRPAPSFHAAFRRPLARTPLPLQRSRAKRAKVGREALLYTVELRPGLRLGIRQYGAGGPRRHLVLSGPFACMPCSQRVNPQRIIGACCQQEGSR